MVLINVPTPIPTIIKLIGVIALFSFISACSSLESKPSSNNSSIIPVASDHSTPPPSTHSSEKDSSKKPTLLKSPDAAEKVDENNKPLPSSQQRVPSDVLTSILDSAKKAISLQEWLRAQRHLEHALRVAPKNPEVFYIYADVYEGLGVDDQVINMLKRAKFLAKPDSEIKRLASERLEQLTQ